MEPCTDSLATKPTTSTEVKGICWNDPVGN